MTDIAFLDSEHGWMVTYGGQILRYRGPTTEVEKRRNILVPGEFRLEQNYPNPFNPVTTIKYTVGGTRGSGLGTSKTMIAVYDLLGRQVSTLVDEAKAPGSYEVTFDSSRLASGVYICRMTAGAFRQSRKMLLIK